MEAFIWYIFVMSIINVLWYTYLLVKGIKKVVGSVEYGVAVLFSAAYVVVGAILLF